MWLPAGDVGSPRAALGSRSPRHRIGVEIPAVLMGAAVECHHEAPRGPFSDRGGPTTDPDLAVVGSEEAGERDGSAGQTGPGCSVLADLGGVPGGQGRHAYWIGLVVHHLPALGHSLDQVDVAMEDRRDAGVVVGSDGERHLGAALGGDHGPTPEV